MKPLPVIGSYLCRSIRKHTLGIFLKCVMELRSHVGSALEVYLCLKCFFEFLKGFEGVYLHLKVFVGVGDVDYFMVLILFQCFESEGKGRDSLFGSSFSASVADFWFH